MKGGRRASKREHRRAVVLGATGHVGSAVVRELLSRGFEVTAATRRSAPPPNLEGLQITLAPGDADEPSQLDAWVQGHDLVIDAATPYPIWMFRPSQPSEVDPQGYAQARTERLLSAVRRHGAELAVIGSFTTLPHPGAQKGDLEPRILYLSHPYFAVKDTVESMVLAAARAGLPVALVNPTAFLGPWDGKPREMCVLPAVVTGRVPLTASRVVNVIDVRDVAFALISAVEAKRFGERIPLAGHDVRISDLAAEVCRIHKVPPPGLPGSTRLGAALSYWAEALWGAAGKRPPVPALPMLLVRYSYPMEPSLVQRELGGTIRPLTSTLSDSLAWYCSVGYL